MGYVYFTPHSPTTFIFNDSRISKLELRLLIRYDICPKFVAVGRINTLNRLSILFSRQLYTFQWYNLPLFAILSKQIGLCGGVKGKGMNSPIVGNVTISSWCSEVAYTGASRLSNRYFPLRVLTARGKWPFSYTLELPCLLNVSNTGSASVNVCVPRPGRSWSRNIIREAIYNTDWPVIFRPAYDRIPISYSIGFWFWLEFVLRWVFKLKIVIPRLYTYNR